MESANRHGTNGLAAPSTQAAVHNGENQKAEHQKGSMQEQEDGDLVAAEQHKYAPSPSLACLRLVAGVTAQGLLPVAQQDILCIACCGPR